MTWNVRYFGQGSKGLRASRAGLERAAHAVADDHVPKVGPLALAS